MYNPLVDILKLLRSSEQCVDILANMGHDDREFGRVCLNSSNLMYVIIFLKLKIY